MIKTCSNCKDDKDLTEFGKDKTRSDGYNVYCLTCTRKKRSDNRDKINDQKRQSYWENHEKSLEEKNKDYYKHQEKRCVKMKEKYSENPEYYKKRSNDYYVDNKEMVAEKTKIYREKNKELIIQRKRDYYQKNKVHCAAKSKAWKKNNPEKRREMDKRYFEKNPIRKIIRNLRSRIYSVLKQSHADKADHTMAQLGCTPIFLKQYLESKFHPYTDETGKTVEMSWEHFGSGKGTFQIDHLKALCLFDLQNPAEQLLANHYTNLQPLWFDEHNVKSQNDLAINAVLKAKPSVANDLLYFS